MWQESDPIAPAGRSGLRSDADCVLEPDIQGIFMRSILSSLVALGFLAIAELTIATAAASPAQLDRITIEAGKKRQVLQHRVNHFVASVLVKPWGSALFGI